MLRGRKNQFKRLKQKQGKKMKELKQEQRSSNKGNRSERGREELKKQELSKRREKQVIEFWSWPILLGGINYSTKIS